jgi:endogenous inhibitor of DNA gyrase (YacG/DUF329 family)
MKYSTCQICSQSFLIKPGNKGIYCTVLCSEQGKIIRERAKAALNLITNTNNYLLAPNRCQECSKILDYNKRKNKFCSRNCGATHSNRPRKKIKPVPRFKVSKIIDRSCPTCGNIFKIRQANKKVFCSKSCIKRGGVRNGSGRAKTGYYKGIYCGSTYELAFLIWNLDHNVPIKRCNKIINYWYNGQQKKYFPDFEILNQIFEIKGRMTNVDYIKINTANAILINKEKISFYIDYVCKKYKINTASLYRLYD